MSYNLDQETPESFEFILGGYHYKMRYPTVLEVTEAQKLEGSDKQMDWLYQFISPVTESGPDIRSAVNAMSIKQIKGFNDMILSEFGLEV